jgi:DOPA 4,5-dioxygenase
MTEPILLPPGIHPIAGIASWHAHVYFGSEEQRETALWLRAEVAKRFLVRLGRWHDVEVGPHSCAMYQIAFECRLFAEFVPWLMLNHRGLSILVHPNTRSPRRDHVDYGAWIGEKLSVKPERLAEDVARADEAGEPNTAPLGES